jgi:hypothetical protein
VQRRDSVEYLLEQPACDIISAAHLTHRDADRLAHDPIMRAIADRGGLDRRAASTRACRQGRIASALAMSFVVLVELVTGHRPSGYCEPEPPPAI